MKINDIVKNIHTSVTLNTHDAPRQLHIEITADVIRFNSKWDQTEISVKEAKTTPSRIATCVFAVVPHVYPYEAENVSKHVLSLA